MEIMAFKDGFLLIAFCGLYLVHVECDAFNVVLDVNSYSFDFVFDILIEDIVELLGVVRDRNYRHISQKCNMVAHTLLQ